MGATFFGEKEPGDASADNGVGCGGHLLLRPVPSPEFGSFSHNRWNSPLRQKPPAVRACPPPRRAAGRRSQERLTETSKLPSSRVFFKLRLTYQIPALSGCVVRAFQV